MRPTFRISLMAILGAILTVSAPAVPITFNFSGAITTASSLIPAGTVFSGQYTYDPAAPGSGTYSQPAGSFTFFVGPAGSLGSLTSTTGNVIQVGNDVPCCFGGFAQDFFNFSATNGTFTGFGGHGIDWTLTSVSFANGVIGTPGPLTNNSLTGVPNTLAAWGAGNMNIYITNFFAGAFTSTTTAIGTITSIQSGPLRAGPDVYQVGYASNLLTGDSYVNLTNAGTRNGFDPAGGICANVYVFDPSEEMVACCSCYVSPDGLRSFSVQQDLVSKTLTPATPNGVVIKLLASVPGSGSTCDATTPTAVTLETGLRGWGTALHLNSTTSSYQVSEGAFRNAFLSDSELTKLTTFCRFIQATGSTFGICKSCRVGGLLGGDTR